MSFIRNKLFKQKIIDFSGLRYQVGEKDIYRMPTDIDVYLHFEGKLFVFAEAKYNGSKLSAGQRWAFESLCDACHKPPERYAVFFIVSHNSTQTNEDINIAECNVILVRYNNEWKEIREQITLREAIDKIIDFHNLEI